MVICGYRGLYMVIEGFTWLYMVIEGFTCMVIEGYTWVLVIRGYRGFRMTMHYMHGTNISIHE